MKAPSGLDRVTIFRDAYMLGPYPPLGFVGIVEAEIGNGDYFGLYWPFGRENVEPVICDMLHDQSGLEYSFSTLDKFVGWLELNDWERGDNEVEDEEASSNLFHEAKASLKENELDKALEYLQIACDTFPENSEYWSLQSSLYQRLRKNEEATIAGLRSVLSNWVFGMPNESALRTLRRPSTKEILNSDPIIERLDELTFRFGGTKENANYPILGECVAEYLNASRPIEAIVLYHNYAYMMCGETSAFQERYGFNRTEWQTKFAEMCLQHLGDDRTFIPGTS